MPSRRTSFSSSSSSSPPLPPSSSSGLTESEWLELPPFWDPETVPAGDSEEFLSLVSYEARGDSPFTPNEKFRTRWRDPANPRTSASFGNNGVTASVNPAGELIQLSAYLGLGTSGMFAANRSDFSEPYWVQDRAHELLQLGREYVRIGFGLERPRRWNRAVFEGYHCDRWPVYTSSSEGLAVSTTWMVHDGVILQRTHLDNLKDEPQVVPLSVLVDVHIFALDHVKSAHEFNEKGIFGHLKQPNDCGWIAINRMANQDTTDDIAVLMSVFVDGRPYMLDERHRDEDSFRIDIPILPNSRGPQVVVAYKMATIPQRADAALLNWEDFVIPGEAANFDKHLEETEGLYVGITASELVRKREHSAEAAGATRSAIEFMGLPDDGKSQVQHIDYSVRRNLEHILSVCSVPIESSSGGELIALTCGDLSGHRITSSASFFAFSFLIEVAKLIQNSGSPDEKDAFRHLRSRVERVCRGHMRWLIAAQKTRKGCFSANYWVNGTFIETGDSLLAPSDSHIDTAFQLLKACDFRDTFLSQEPDLTDRLLKSTAMNWVRVLHWADRRKVCAWSHSKVEGSNKYRLSIHTWIWKALKAIESSLPELAAMVNNQSNPDADDNRDGEIIKRLASANVQKEVLRRFTAGNDGHGKRMLATTRSSRETRFLLHASDTVLFYGLDQDFFLKNTPFNDLWQNTLEAQLQHKEKYEASWENLIRYALAVMMGARNLKINDRSPQDLIKSAMGVLLRAAGPNCLFYGVIDATTKEIELFQSEADRDFFFHASFEIPFILLTHCRKINSILEGSAQMSDEPQHSSTLTDSKDEQSQDALERAKSNSKMQSHTAGDGQSTAHEAAHRNKHNSELIGMKKSQPFNSLFDQSSIVDLDEEWLYNYPSFLSRDELLKDAFFDSYVKEMAMTNQENDDAGGSVVVKAAKALMMTGLRGGVTSINLDKEHLLDQTGIADVPKQKRGRKRNGPDMRILDSEFLWQHLRRVRTASKAKKRLIWMQRPSNRVALTCYITSQEEERPAFALFLERHANFENYFYEDVTLALNEWDTELHLSFYQLEVEINDAGRFLTNKAFKSRPHALVPEQYVPLSLGNGQDLAIVRTSLGFRFYGDFFDRHWTCYSIEHTPEIFSRLMGSPIGSKNDLVRQQDCWRQRKVLELHLFDRMIREIVRGTERTLNAIRTELGVNRGSFLSPILNSDDYFTTSVQWQKSQEILELLDEELSDTIATISKWDARERERGHERPRWTRNDERKYRLVIRKLEGTNRRRVRDLKKQHENLQMLKEMLIRSQAQIRDDLSLRGAENIRFFTYVTVVFLPLGFAASIFSMSETPPVTRILGDMAACAVVAVFITIMMLANAKKLNSGLRKLKMGIIILFQPLTMAVKTFSSQSRRNSPLILGEMERVEKQDAKDEEASPSREMNEINTDGPPPPPRSRFQHEKPGALRFWLTYIFLEFPARKVLRAFYTARNPNFRRLSTYASFIWGVVLLPVFGVTYPLHVALLNIADFTRVCWRFLNKKMQFPVDEFQEDEEFKTRLSQWVHPPQNYRPLKDGQLSSSESEAKACPQDADDREESEAMKRMRGNGL